MSDPDLDALEAVAQAATPGPWEYDPDEMDPGVWSDHGSSGTWVAGEWSVSDPNAAHIATFDPPTVLALIAELRDSRARIAAVEAENARLLSPERDTTGLTYGDRKAWEHHLDRAEAAEQKVAAQAEVIEQVQALADAKQAEIERINATPDPLTGRCSTMRAYVLVEELIPLLAAAPTPPAEAEGLSLLLAQVRSAERAAGRWARENEDANEIAVALAEVAGYLHQCAHPTPPTTDAEEARTND